MAPTVVFDWGKYRLVETDRTATYREYNLEVDVKDSIGESSWRVIDPRVGELWSALKALGDYMSKTPDALDSLKKEPSTEFPYKLEDFRDALGYGNRGDIGWRDVMRLIIEHRDNAFVLKRIKRQLDITWK